MGTDLLLAAFHEDVDVVAGLSEVDEVDDVGVLYLLADDHFRLDALDDIHLQFSRDCWSPCFWAIFVRKIYLPIQLLLRNDLAGQSLRTVSARPGSKDLTVRTPS